MAKKQKIIIYQVLTRLFGNQQKSFVPWGTIEENGVGKMSDFTPKALQAIKELGISHIWYTGILHHAVIRDYSDVGISHDHPSVVKGRAGSPYAVKDYYSVDPDLANDPAERMEEFEQLVTRTHQAGLKLIIDLIPNHVARHYHSVGKPSGTEDFGYSDDKTVEYHRDNNFYYIPGKAFELPEWKEGYQPLGGRQWPLDLWDYSELPAKWTGNNGRNHQPDFYDWYETVKLNFGVKPDGSYDFVSLPEAFGHKDVLAHYTFWQQQEVPDTWKKMKEIALFWLEKGVDGFRFDMAEMVPVPFWSYLNSTIKHNYPDTLLIAEVYQPQLYDDFIFRAKMDLLYDKVDLYDILRDIIMGKASCQDIFPISDRLYYLADHLLHFMENHDEDRIAGPAFVGNAVEGVPAMVVSACLDKGAVMVYFGQECGEDANESAGFGGPGKTSIFDYIRAPRIQEWINGGNYDGGQLDQSAMKLRDFYQKLLNFCLESDALKGAFYDLHRHNAGLSPWVRWDKVYVFARYTEQEKLLIISNFDQENDHNFRVSVYYDLITRWQLEPGKYLLVDQLDDKKTFMLMVENNHSYVDVFIEKSQAMILKVKSGQ